MQWCRFCGKIIETGRPYDPGELWICKECQDEHFKLNEEEAKRLQELMKPSPVNH